MHKFISWNQWECYDLETAHALDVALVTYAAEAELSKVQMAYLHAGVELALPSCKGQLHWLHSCNLGMLNSQPAVHTLAMPRAAALLIGVTLSQMGHPWMGALVVIQQARGMRPGEVLNLLGKDVTLPEDGVYNVGMLTLRQTKAGRAQAVRLDPQQHGLELALLRYCRKHTPSESKISRGVTVSSYSGYIRRTARRLGLPDYTSHSPRAGFVSDSWLRGDDFVLIRETGRWLSDRTLRLYCDAVSTIHQAHAGPLRQWINVAQCIEQQPSRFFPQLSFKHVVNPSWLRCNFDLFHSVM